MVSEQQPGSERRACSARSGYAATLPNRAGASRRYFLKPPVGPISLSQAIDGYNNALIAKGSDWVTEICLGMYVLYGCAGCFFLSVGE